LREKIRKYIEKHLEQLVHLVPLEQLVYLVPLEQVVPLDRVLATVHFFDSPICIYLIRGKIRPIFLLNKHLFLTMKSIP
jgi:hypothetical protein